MIAEGVIPTDCPGKDCEGAELARDVATVVL